MLIFRAFSFSFSILWRYALVLPILALVFCVYAIIAAMFIFLFGVVSPIVAVLIAAGVGLASSVIPAMIGTRIGLQAKGIQPRNSYASLFLPAIGYGLFEGFCVMIVLVATLGVLTLATPLDVLDLLNLNAQGTEVAFVRLLDENAPVTLAVFAAALFWIVAVRAALLVPFAGASVGMDPSGRAHTPFFGFGSGFWSIMILVIISYVGSSLIVPIIMLGSHLLGQGDFMSEAVLQIERATSETEFDWIGIEAIVLVSAFTLLMLWFFSLQCAAAVLVFQNHKMRYDIGREDYVKPSEEAEEPPMPKTDMRELIRSRMPDHRR